MLHTHHSDYRYFSCYPGGGLWYKGKVLSQRPQQDEISATRCQPQIFIGYPLSARPCASRALVNKGAPSLPHRPPSAAGRRMSWWSPSDQGCRESPEETPETAGVRAGQLPAGETCRRELQDGLDMVRRRGVRRGRGDLQRHSTQPPPLQWHPWPGLRGHPEAVLIALPECLERPGSCRLSIQTGSESVGSSLPRMQSAQSLDPSQHCSPEAHPSACLPSRLTDRRL